MAPIRREQLAMTEYQAPLDDMRFVLNELADLDAVAQ